MRVKQMIYILILLFLLVACNQNSSKTRIPKADSGSVVPDTLLKTRHDKATRKIVTDSLVFYSDSLYSDLELNFSEISKNQFESFKRKYKTSCMLDSGHFISGSGLYVKHDCNEICETYLAERNTNRKMLLPSNYDSGILAMQLSPGCNYFLVCSSYDGPDYDNYYEDRAEFFIFKVNPKTGLKGIRPAFKYYTKAWSIDDLTWVNDKTIALKIYEENRGGDGSSVNYKYFRAAFYE